MQVAAATIKNVRLTDSPRFDEFGSGDAISIFAHPAKKQKHEDEANP
jgi:hypothetical protein